MGLNKVIIQGNLTRDPETKFTPSGTAICQIGIASNRKFTQNGESREEVLFADIELFGKTAELAQKHLTKGQQCIFEGRLKLDQWDDKQTGQKRSKMKIICDQMHFVGGGKSSGEGTQSRGNTTRTAPPKTQSKPAQAAAPRDDAGRDQQGDDGAPDFGGDENMPF